MSVCVVLVYKLMQVLPIWATLFGVSQCHVMKVVSVYEW